MRWVPLHHSGARGPLGVLRGVATLEVRSAIFVFYGRFPGLGKGNRALITLKTMRVGLKKLRGSARGLRAPKENFWRECEGVEPTRDSAGCPATVLKTARPTGTHPLPSSRNAPRCIFPLLEPRWPHRRRRLWPGAPSSPARPRPQRRPVRWFPSCRLLLHSPAHPRILDP